MRTTTRPANGLILLLSLVGGLINAGYGSLFALLDEFRDDYGIGETALGGVIAIGFAGGFVSQLLIAPYADRGHARRLVVAGLVLNVASMAVLSVAESVEPMLIARLLMGLGIGMAAPAVRRIVICADPDNLGRNLGRLLSADVAGFAIGPALAALLAGPFGLAAPFVVSGIACAIAIPFLARLKVEESVDAPRERFAIGLLRQRTFAAAVALGAGVFLMIGAFDALWSLALDDLDTSEWIATLGISLFAMPLVILGSVGGRISQRFGPFRVGSLGLLLGAVFMAGYGLVPTGGAMFAVAMVHSLSDGLTVSSTGVAVGMVIPPERQAGAQGVLGGMQTLAAGITAVTAAAIYDHVGRTAAYLAAAGAMVAMVALGVALAGRSFGLRGRHDGGNQDSGDEHPEPCDTVSLPLIV